MSAWEEYKKNKIKNGEEVFPKARPWHILDPDQPKASEELQKQRYSICKECPEFIKITKQCKKCGCLMKLKTQLENAQCPIGKW